MEAADGGLVTPVTWREVPKEMKRQTETDDAGYSVRSAGKRKRLMGD